MTFKEVYLDHHTVSRPSPAVIERINYFYYKKWGSLSVPHQKGQELYQEVSAAQQALSSSLKASTLHLFKITSGSAEGIFDLFIDIYLNEIRETGKNNLLSFETEEPSILVSMSSLEKLGCFQKFLPIKENGTLCLNELQKALKPKTSLLSLSWANGLTGVIQPVKEIVNLCHAKGVKVHLNASHVVGKLPISFDEIGADFFSFDGDKIETPKELERFLFAKPERPCQRPYRQLLSVVLLLL